MSLASYVDAGAGVAARLTLESLNVADSSAQTAVAAMTPRVTTRSPV
jgi:hypothetical protein